MSPRALWRWWRDLPNNPIYEREKGRWGKPNPYYEKLSRLAPFIIIGAIVLGLCTAVYNPSFFNGNDALFALYCFLCLPSALLSIVTVYTSLMVPALTAPAIRIEISQGTWEILRATPQSGRAIIAAKLMGALSRLRVWPVLFVLSLIQGLIFACGFGLAGGQQAFWSGILGITVTIKPWLEILFAAFLGMYASTKVRTVMSALAASYVGVVSLKIFNNSTVWFAVLELLQESDNAIVLGNLMATAVYILIILALSLALMRQGDRLGAG